MTKAEKPDFIDKKPLFDRLFVGSKITPKDARQQYDGSVFNGLTLVQVEFNKTGDLVQIRSFNTSDLTESVPFKESLGGGWVGEGGFYGAATVLGRRLQNIVTSTREEWNLWKETESEHPGIDFRTWKAERIGAIAEEHQRINLEQLSQPAEDTQEAYRLQAATANQRYHDHFVKKYLAANGQLSEEDMDHYKRAMELERQGLVRPYASPKQTTDDVNG